MTGEDIALIFRRIRIVPQSGRVAIVDPDGSGTLLAPEVIRHGYRCVCVLSQNPAANVRSATGEYDALVRHGGVLQDSIDQLKRWHVRHVIPGCESGVKLADELSEALNTLTNGTELSNARRQKDVMADTLQAKGLQVPTHFSSSRLEQILEWLSRSGQSYPVVVKPPHSMSSEDVCLCRDEDELRRGFACIQGRPNKLGLLNDRVIVQEFLDGDEFVVDTVSHGGRHHVAAIWKYGKSIPFDAAGRARFDSKELLPCEGSLQQRLRTYVFAVLDALEIRYGAAHSEVMWVDGVPRLLETGARTHGGPSNHLLCRLATGTCQTDLTVESYLNPNRFLSRVGQSYKLSSHVLQVLVLAPREGMLRSLDVLNAMKGLPSFHRMQVNANSEQAVPPCIAMIELVHADKKCIGADHRRIREWQSTELYNNIAP